VTAEGSADAQVLAFVAPQGAGRIDRWLAGVAEISRNRVQALLEQGRVEVDGVTVRRSHRLVGGEQVVLQLPPTPRFELRAQDIPVQVLHQDPHLLVVVKPAGMVVHPSRGHPDGTLVNALLGAGHSGDDALAGDPARPGIVHRLDRGTSGVMVVARTPDAHEGLAAQFASHDIERRYLALVWGDPTQARGTIDAPLARHPRDRLRFAVIPGGKHAITHYRVLDRCALPIPGSRSGGRLALVECRLETGRTHQVRVHLTHLGHPLVGDPTYRRRGIRTPELLRSELKALDHQLLHAWHLGFRHPVSGELMDFHVEPPLDFQRVLGECGFEVGESGRSWEQK
jgi:23S rRNA pseudouridine1911/1915/1917 synthase